jgi:hypothetical protein
MELGVQLALFMAGHGLLACNVPHEGQQTSFLELPTQAVSAILQVTTRWRQTLEQELSLATSASRNCSVGLLSYVPAFTKD